MSPDLIKDRIQAQIANAQVEMSGAECNFAVIVTSDSFEGKSPLQRHRMVNDLFKTEFESGALHALSIKTLLPGS